MSCRKCKNDETPCGGCEINNLNDRIIELETALKNIAEALPLKFFITENACGEIYIDHSIIEASDYVDHSNNFDKAMREVYSSLIKKD